MSYILDALRKSEQERQAGAVPTLGAATRADPGRRRLWLAGVIGAALLASAAAAAWLLGPGLLNGARDTAGSPAAPATPPAEPAAAVEDTGGATAARSQAERSPEPESATGLEELDSAARARLDGLSVNVVSYSDAPERRFVMLDQRIVRESESVADGVVVKRILPDGVVLGVGSEEVLLKPQ